MHSLVYRVLGVVILLGLNGTMPFPCQADVQSKASLRSQIAALLAKRNLLALPSVSSQVRSTSSSRGTSSLTLAASSSQPPTLSSIPGYPIKDIFWRKIDGVNVIDALNMGDPGPQYCGEFFSGNQDGQSGGLGACHMAESVGYSYSQILESGMSLCYMRNFPTKKNLNAGGIVVNSGKLPTGGIEKLFSPPEGKSSRIVKVNITGDSGPGQGEGEGGGDSKDVIFLEVMSQKQNTNSGNLYKASIWFCDSSDNSVQGYDLVSISKALKFSNEHGGDDGFGTNMSTSEGYLTLSGNNLIWDTSRSRKSSTLFSENGTSNTFKSQIEIATGNLIKVKRMDSFQDQLGKGYMVTKYSGSSALNLRFLSGAFKDWHNGSTFSAATEYRDSFYAVDSSSALLDDVENVDLTAGFFAGSLDLSLDLSKYSCAVEPDVELTMDTDNSSVQTSLSECGKESLRNMHFCHDAPEVQQADQNFGQMCRMGPP